MRILTATLSIVFLLLWIVLAAMLKPWEMVEEIKSAPTNAAVAFWLFSFFIWVVFRMLDRLYRHVHPAAYETWWSMSSDEHGFTLTQALVSALRTSVQCLAIPSVSLSVLLLASVPLLVVLPNGSGAGVAYFWSAAIATMLFVIAVLGWLVQLSYGRGVLRLMQQKSATTVGDKSDAHGDDDEHSDSQSKPVQFHTYGAAEPVPTSSRGGEMLRAAKRVGRLVRLRDTGAPIAAMAGSIAAAYVLAPDKIDTWIGTYSVIWAVLLAVAWFSSTFRLYDRTPLRQLRLGIGLCVHAFLVLCAVPFVVLSETSGRSGRPAQQWTIVRVTGQWVSSLLRSTRLFWIPATLLAALAFHGLDTGTEAMSLILISFCAGIIAFEITYRTLDCLVRSRQQGSNSLVFLRVFGDRRRGRFLFLTLRRVGGGWERSPASQHRMCLCTNWRQTSGSIFCSVV